MNHVHDKSTRIYAKCRINGPKYLRRRRRINFHRKTTEKQQIIMILHCGRLPERLRPSMLATYG